MLRVVDGSRLMVLAKQGSHRQWLLDMLEGEGVDRQRVTLVGMRSRPRYLELYQGIDICLDTLPYNGQTTTLDALWMGVPVVTQVGQTACSRAGLSIMVNLGMPELAPDAPQQFADTAVRLAEDLPRLARLRATLRQRLERSLLMDAPRFARSVEAAYRAMWRRWCAG